MIYSLRGTLLYSDNASAAIECAGVGYRFTASLKTLSSLPAVGREAFVYTFMNVRQDGVDLFGFSTEKELEAFKMVTSVSGIGPKIGISIMSEFTAEQLFLLIASGDAKAISRANGVGVKSAQRIVLELKDKVGSIGGEEVAEALQTTASVSGNNSSRDAVAALVQFGYSQSEASAAVSKCDITKPTDAIIKQALRVLSSL